MENNIASRINKSIGLDDSTVAPLTDVQMGIWLADHISSQRNTFTIAHKVHITGNLDSKYLLEAIQLGLKEADTVQAVYREYNGVPTQQLECSDLEYTPAWTDISNQSDGQAYMDSLIQQDLDAELTLSSDVPLVRQIIFKVSDQQYVWYQRFHHIMLDGFSFNAFTARVASIYQ
ncbi:MAG: hypothetical protein KKA05_11390, partial [Alphaproteobacteria bacterium]|nr:hypothetical protein [Alphaproteobacteria bacterium]